MSQQPWQSVPFSHRLALKSASVNSVMQPASNFNSPSLPTEGAIPIHERTSPHFLRSQARSGIKSPGLSGMLGMSATQGTLDAASGLSNTIPDSLGKL